MHILFILIGIMLGGEAFNISGAILGGVLGYLAAELFTLKKRLVILERQLAVEQRTLAKDEVVFSPVDESFGAEPEHMAGSPGESEKIPVTPKTETSTDQQPVSSSLPGKGNFVENIEKTSTGLAELIRRFVTGGNLVLKVGLIILFLGVAFLIKYAAQQNLLPIEFRLAGAALGGLGLLVVGWRLRKRVGGYGLGLQGGGVGILYLVVYGAAKLYNMLPITFSLALMVGLVVLSGLLAVLQNARILAVFGIVGGFLAPVLMSTGAGSHVMLFSYYALLNAGILGIAWYKAWRELNLLGFFFTFGIATFWGNQAYQPAYFNSTEPFLILYFLFFLAISVLFAHRQPVQLRGFIDGPLVFGLPLIVTGLQYELVKDFEYGMAISAAVLGCVYLLLATLLWKRLAEGMRMLCESFLALGVMFATLTIPLALDNSWTTAAWAIEGGAMVWVGIRQHRQLARIFGLLLQLGAAWIFIDEIYYPFGAIPFLNSYFFGSVFIATAAGFSSYCFWLHREQLRKWERDLHLPLLVWSICWWYLGGFRECGNNFGHMGTHNIALLFGSASTMLMSIIARKSDWHPLVIAQAVFLPIMSLAMLVGLIDSGDTHLLYHWGALAWLIAFYSQYRMLHQFDILWPRWLAGHWHVKTLWLLVILCCFEATWLLDDLLKLSEDWIVVGWGVIPSGSLLLLIIWGRKLAWPIVKWQNYYFGIGMTLPVVFLFLWSVLSLLFAGNPTPLPYFPLINPLELSVFFVILVVSYWAKGCRGGSCFLPSFLPLKATYWLIAILIFLWLNGGVARGVHFYAGIPYDLEALYVSVIFQAAIAALWSFLALSVTVWAARAGSRPVWCCGAVLLGLVVLKLFVIDLSGTGTVARIVSFLVVGVLMLVIGYFSPMPPAKPEESA